MTRTGPGGGSAVDAKREDPAAGEARRASDAIVARLRRMITTLELAPGALVSEAYLLDLLECSRTPLREALQRLAQEHLVLAVPRRGVWIADLSIIDFGQLVEAVDGFDRHVIRLAAARITDAELQHLATVLKMAETAQSARDFSALAELDFQFHNAIVKASRNRYAVDTMAPLLRLVARFSFVGFRKAGTAEGAIGDHRRILDALRTRDPESCAERVSEHSEKGRERIRAAL